MSEISLSTCEHLNRKFLRADEIYKEETKDYADLVFKCQDCNEIIITKKVRV